MPELQTLGWFARFPEKIDSPYINLQLLDKYGIESGIPREDQSRQIEKAFRELDARLVRITGRQPYADDLFESLRQKGPEAGETYFRGAAERNQFCKGRANRTAGFGSADKAVMPVFG